MGRITNKRPWGRDYPNTVDVPAPPGGHGRKLDAVRDWCRTHCRDWQAFGATFYFWTEEEAEAFQRTWED